MNEATDPRGVLPAQRAPGCRDTAQDELFARLYADLKRLARREVRRYGPAMPLGPTTLLHEAYLQLAGRESLAFADTGRFLAYASRAMRGLVIDRLRAQAASKRGGGLDITSFDTETAETLDDPGALEEISAALDELAVLQPELARVVDLKFFCGFTMIEIAAQCGSSQRTVQRQWEKARALLYQALRAP
jgi:RNA polymerase sigma factor (TIGR02999 family)